MSETVVKIEGLYKKFTTSLKRSMLYGTYDAMRDMAGISYDVTYLRKKEFWALQNINLELKRGETLGLIGQNGCGKTTLLRLINGIFPPDKGRITIKGRIGALIAVGAGFHPHMTGRENIFLNGTILGMTIQEIRKKFDEIVDFAEIGEFLDAPVATYSSGMAVRLGFAIAIHCEPDILLVDEILAVGDVAFQMKCFEKINSILRSGVSVIFVSHSISNHERLCREGILIEKGRQIYSGKLREVVKEYMSLLDQHKIDTYKITNEVGVKNFKIQNVIIYEEGKRDFSNVVQFGKNIVIEFDYYFIKRGDKKYQLRVGLKTIGGRDIQKILFQELTFVDGINYNNEKNIVLKDKGKMKIMVLEPKLFPQVYKLDIAVSPINMNYHEGGLIDTLFQVIEPKDISLYFEYGNESITEFDYKLIN